MAGPSRVPFVLVQLRKITLDGSTAITTGATPTITTASAHNLKVNHKVYLSEAGMTEIENQPLTVTEIVSATKFKIAETTTSTHTAGVGLLYVIPSDASELGTGTKDGNVITWNGDDTYPPGDGSAITNVGGGWTLQSTRDITSETLSEFTIPTGSNQVMCVMYNIDGFNENTKRWNARISDAGGDSDWEQFYHIATESGFGSETGREGFGLVYFTRGPSNNWIMSWLLSKTATPSLNDFATGSIIITGLTPSLPTKVGFRINDNSPWDAGKISVYTQ